MRARRAIKRVNYAHESDDAMDHEDMLPYTPAGAVMRHVSDNPSGECSDEEGGNATEANASSEPSSNEQTPKALMKSDQTSPGLRNRHYEASKPGFLSLPPELRLNIYKHILAKNSCVDFGYRRGFSHSSALLTVCKTIAQEGAVVLYSSNKFILRPSKDKAGSYFSETWQWLGYSGVLNFLTAIGPSNISLLKHVGLVLQDAAPTDEPKLGTEDRRFQHNDELLRSLELLADHAISLETLKIHFSGREKFWHNRNIPIRNFSNVLTKIHADIVILDDYEDSPEERIFLWPLGKRSGGSSNPSEWRIPWCDNKLCPSDREYFKKRLTREQPLNPRLRSSYEEALVKAKEERKSRGYYW